MAYRLEEVVSPRWPIYQQLNDYYRYCEFTRNFTEKTMELKTKDLNYFVEFSGLKTLENVSNDIIDEWVVHQKSRGNCGKTINGRLSQLRTMLTWQRDSNLEMPNLKLSLIVKQKEEPSRAVFYTRAQIETALKFAGLREEVMIRLTFDCGLRISELIKIRLCDISEREISIIGKGRKQRFVVMSEETRERLDDWIEFGKIDDYLWPSWTRDHEHVSGETARTWMRKAFCAAKLTNFYPHALRHSFATELEKLGLSTREIQAGLGHTSARTTEIYLHGLNGSDIKEIYNRRYSIVEQGRRQENLRLACDDDPESALIVALIKQCRKRGSDVDFDAIIKSLKLA